MPWGRGTPRRKRCRRVPWESGWETRSQHINRRDSGSPAQFQLRLKWMITTSEAHQCISDSKSVGNYRGLNGRAFEDHPHVLPASSSWFVAGGQGVRKTQDAAILFFEKQALRSQKHLYLIASQPFLYCRARYARFNLVEVRLWLALSGHLCPPPYCNYE